MTGRVWGFLKYHHPQVAAGELHWDYELLRRLPDILEARDKDSRNQILSKWIDSLGLPQRCNPCANAPKNPHLLPDLAWISDSSQLGLALAQQLQQVYTNRFAGAEHFYVDQAPMVGNPVFARELAYPSDHVPEAGLRLLALLRLWNIIEYWFPYRDQIDGDWRATLVEFVPRLIKADSWDSYKLELFALISRIGDAHANLWQSLDARPPHGECRWPIHVRFVERRPTVVGLVGEAQTGGFEIGDIIESVDGHPIADLMQSWAPYYSASNETGRRFAMAQFLPRGTCGGSSAEIVRRDRVQTLTPQRTKDTTPGFFRLDRAGEAFQLLSSDVAYLKLSAVRQQDIDQYIEQASGKSGFVIDIRNYPSEFVVFALGTRLVSQKTPFARFTIGALHTPGVFSWTEPLMLVPQSPGYAGKIVVLVDELSMSQAEYTAMAFRAAPNAVVIGSTTAGADGNVSTIPLPGRLQSGISGIGVFYPDKRPTQRIGIVPDIVATPTVVGIQQGRDEILETALRHILGPEVPEETILRIAKRPVQTLLSTQ